MAFPATTYTNGVTAFTALENKVAALGMTSSVLDQPAFIAAFLANFLDDPQLGAGAVFAAGTITASEPGTAITQTWNDAGVTFKASTITITDTTSAAGSLFVDYLVASSSKFSVTKAGLVTAAAGFVATTGGLTVTAGGITITAGKVQCAASTTSAASLNLGNAGTAPSSPANGDMWIESNTVKVRLNGATVTVQTA